MRHVLKIILIAFVTACAPFGTEVEPDVTSYPRERVIQEEVNMWVAPGIHLQGHTSLLSVNGSEPLYESSSNRDRSVTYDFQQTVLGDTAVVEFFVTPSRGSGDSEDGLYTLAPSLARQECKGDFRVTNTTYFLGDEATVRMMGIDGRSLRVTARCEISRGVSFVLGERALRQFAEDFADVDFFDASGKFYDTTPQSILSAVEKYVSSKGMTIVRRANVGSTSFVRASRDPSDLGGNQDFFAIQASGTGTFVTLISARYQLTSRTYSVFRGAPELTGRAPIPRDLIYRVERGVFGALSGYLGSN